MSRQVCSRCVMDETVPRIRFDEKGVCNFCDFHDILENEYSLENPDTRKCLDAIYASAIEQGKGKKYDCVVGVSGGRDSSYLLYHLVREAGLRCLTVHFNDGFGNDRLGLPSNLGRRCRCGINSFSDEAHGPCTQLFYQQIQ